MTCDHKCFSCTAQDCINDTVYSESNRYCNRSEKQKQYQRDYQKKRRDAARAKGVCIICQKSRATHGTKCYECYLRQKRYDRKKAGIREAWREKGLCYFCGNPTLQGKKTCIRHYKILNNSIRLCNSSPATLKARYDFKQRIWRQKDDRL